ncbi:MAG: 23S rRNA (adenine(2503)-C(2))-methyltransferase RlmN [Myxococcota bacterium]
MLARTPEQWAEALGSWGEPRFRARQVFSWIHRQGVLDPGAMTTLPKGLRARLARESLGLPFRVEARAPSADGTQKLLVHLSEGGRIETVLIPQVHAGARGEVTQCVSSQVGCAMACVFCASGRAGLMRNLRAEEIVGQVLAGRQHLTPGQRLTNVVYMGMGEPLHNYEAVAASLRLLTHSEGIALSHRRVTVSTSGLVPQIDRLARDFDGRVGLAVSLHAVDDERRSRIMPINRKHPLAELMACLRRYPLPKRRRITIEYTLIRGFNDGLDDAERLVDLLEGIPAKVNLIPMNPIPGNPLEAPEAPAVDRFAARVRHRGVSTFVRKQRGDDIAAACGQLALHGVHRRVKVGPEDVVPPEGT